ncbi:hypothetical protein FPY71_07625 [Aureimonas fodinaquatilis]|uniref:Preprotein translocase subunit SecY n=1 Tax=Aureimonas fodinaquatilis TaxID=2565783 RepID=A0A5B0DXU5_9HYPH|nr:hypothetical protein [Aureimonas fodinaquatilis]KAA0970380.1 hypothetical protein FPY71_07625 [Aureimonas fodinaquatilis]
MISATEAKAAVRWKSILAVLIAGVIVLIGQRIPLPGISEDALMQFNKQSSGGLERLSILALGIQPLLSAYLIIEICKLAVPKLGNWSLATPTGRRTMFMLVTLLALVFAALQGIGIAQSLTSLGLIAKDPLSPMLVIATLVAGIAVLAAIADRISIPLLVYGGFWLTLSIFSLHRLSSDISAYLELLRSAAIPLADFLIPVAILATCFVSIVYLSERLARSATVAGADVFAWSIVLVWPPFVAGSIAGALTLLVQMFDLTPETSWQVDGFMIVHTLILIAVLPAVLVLYSGLATRLDPRAAQWADKKSVLAGLAAGQLVVCSVITIASAYWATMLSGAELIALAVVFWALFRSVRLV